MKRVMCIDDSKWGAHGGPRFSEIVTVSWAGTHWNGVPSYSFSEYPPYPQHDFRIFSQKYFVELSDVDEAEVGESRMVEIENIR